MIIVSDLSRIVTLTGRKGKSNISVVLNPGNNNVVDEDWLAVASDEITKQQIATGDFSVIAETVAKEDVNFGNFTDEKAIKLITNESDVSLLEKWQEEEKKSKNRKFILNAIKKQIETLSEKE